MNTEEIADYHKRSNDDGKTTTHALWEIAFQFARQNELQGERLAMMKRSVELQERVYIGRLGPNPNPPGETCGACGMPIGAAPPVGIRKDLPRHRFLPVHDNPFCGECGAGPLHEIHIRMPEPPETETASRWTCPNCAAKNVDSARACVGCGVRLAQVDEVATLQGRVSDLLRSNNELVEQRRAAERVAEQKTRLLDVLMNSLDDPPVIKTADSPAGWPQIAPERPGMFGIWFGPGPARYTFPTEEDCREYLREMGKKMNEYQPPEPSSHAMVDPLEAQSRSLTVEQRNRLWTECPPWVCHVCGFYNMAIRSKCRNGVCAGRRPDAAYGI